MSHIRFGDFIFFEAQLNPKRSPVPLFSLMPNLIIKGVQFPSEEPVQLCPTWPKHWLPLIHRTEDTSMVLLAFQVTTLRDILSVGCDSNLSPASRWVLYHWPSPGQCRLRRNQLQHPLMEEGLALPCARLTLMKSWSHPGRTLGAALMAPLPS